MNLAKRAGTFIVRGIVIS